MPKPNGRSTTGKTKSRSKITKYVPRSLKKAFSSKRLQQKRLAYSPASRRYKSAGEIGNSTTDHASAETTGPSSGRSIRGVVTSVKASMKFRPKRKNKSQPQSKIDVPEEGSSQDAKQEMSNGDSKTHDEIEVEQSNPDGIISKYVGELQPAGRRNSQLRRTSVEMVHRDRIMVGSDVLASTIETMDAMGRKSFKQMVTQYQWLGWVRSLREMDPRLQIFTFFNDIARVGGKDMADKTNVEHVHCPHILRAFQRSSVFSVWRPTSLDAIRKMIVGDARGKGLDIKGKSSKCGMLSGYVPFVQIHSNEKHKKMVRTRKKGARVRIFFKTAEDRDLAAKTLEEVAEEMINMVVEAKAVLLNEDDYEEEKLEEARKRMLFDMEDSSVNHIDDYAPDSFGIDVEERLFFEAFVMRQDITREPGSKYDTGRPSEPAFQDMNFGALRRVAEEDEPRAVIYQYGEAMSPLTLLMAYEEQGSVLPVVSDFDCFLVGSRNVPYEEATPPEQIKLVHWCITQIEKILDGNEGSDSWTKCWLTKLKEESVKGFHPKIPRFGFGDPKSYAMMESVIDRIQHNGAVRHGAECFNYYFPQELDTEFLVVSDDTFSGNLTWKYVGVEELQSILMKKIDQGYTFPLNPKWVLCDKGWKRIYDKLMVRAQERPDSEVSQSLNSWFPPESGLRERIEEISARHPDGFQREAGGDAVDGTAAMDLAQLELKRYMTLRRAKVKLRAILMIMNKFGTDKEVSKWYVIKYRMLAWMKSVRLLDPRLQIFTFFNDIARVGGENLHDKENLEFTRVPSRLRAFQRSSVFTVWRPTSLDAIRKMIAGDARGKGLDIKGKSSKCGMLSGYVPFVQIHSNENHKRLVGTCVKGARVRIFFKTAEDRDLAAKTLEEVAEEMVCVVDNAKTKLSDEDALTQDQVEEFTAQMIQDMENKSVNHIDDYAPDSFGIDVGERLFWETYIMRQDITREPGSKYDTGRPSEPAFQDMNFGALRRVAEEDEPRAVIYQYGEAMSPLTLLMAYEEQGSVLPVVSDFDCFMVGSHNVPYEQPPPPEQIKLVHWCITQIEKILDGNEGSDSWTKCWLTKLKEESVKGFHPDIPRFGFGDPKSYAMMESVIDRIQHNGAVRHGAECFNYYFPQELDTEFLVVSDDTFSGNLTWKYVGVEELQSILMKKIDQGYTFPLNPKWVLCDKGWKRIYDKLMAKAQETPDSEVSQSLNSWFPPESGLRERIEEISARHPDGFQREAGGEEAEGDAVDGTAAMDLAQLELKRYMILRRAKLKLRAALLMTKQYASNTDDLPEEVDR